MALRDAFADLLDTPANPANLAKTRAEAGPQPDFGACESLRILRIGSSQPEKFAEFAIIRRPENAPPALAPAGDSQNSQRGNPLMTAAQADRAHWPAWDDAEINRTVNRIHLFMRRGFDADHAEHLAERLVLRDREVDDRHLCLECSHLMTSGRCAAAALGHLAGVDSRLEPVPTILMRCEAFEVAKGLT